jgi:hypothetical protein
LFRGAIAKKTLLHAPVHLFQCHSRLPRHFPINGSSAPTPTNYQLAKEKLRRFESAQARGESSLPTKTPIADVLSAYVAHTRVPRPMICLNSVIELITRTSTMSLQVGASIPVDAGWRQLAPVYVYIVLAKRTDRSQFPRQLSARTGDMGCQQRQISHAALRKETFMTRCFRALSIVLALVAGFAPLAAVRAADEKPKEKETFFPIMAWNHAPADPAELTKMRECGLTVAGFATVKQLDAIHAAGMKAIVSDARVGGYDWKDVDAADARKKVSSLIAEVNTHPAVMGYYLRDEPPADLFPGLEKVASVVRELAPGKWPYINLFPLVAEPWQLAAKDYNEYVEKFIATCKPPTLSYDHYAIFDDGSLGEHYFHNLEVMRAAAMKNKVPFWNIVLANSHFRFRIPTSADFHFHAYTTLAYGGRGIAYFTYFAPKVGNYRGAPIDQFGNETPTWHNMRYINNQILKLAPTMLKLRSDAVYHFGKIPTGCAGPRDTSLIIGLEADQDHFMAADFTHAEDGSRWVMMVNRNLSTSFAPSPKFRTPPGKVRLLSPYTGELVPHEGEYRWVAPGAGVLLRIDQ